MCLDVVLDSILIFAPHICRVSGNSFYHLWQLKIVRMSVSITAAKTMVHAFITSRIDYCNSVQYGVSAVHLRPLKTVLNSAACMCKQIFDHITADICNLLHWLPVQHRVEYKMCVLIFNCLHQSAPIYLSGSCIPVVATAKQSHLCSPVQGNLVIYIWIFIRHQPMTAKTDETEERSDT